MRRLIPAVFILLLICVQAGAVNFVINGKQVTIPSTVVGGKTYVDPIALCKALGLTAAYDGKQFVVTGSSQIGTQGTTQLAGDWGEFGKAYTLDKDDPIVFTLRDVVVSPSGVIAMCEDEFEPEEGNIFLTVKYTLHNPQHDDYPVTGNGSFIVFTLVDSNGKNYTHCNYAAQEKDNSNLDGVRLKPAQKVDVFTLIEVPKNAQIHKLIVEPYENEPVVRYDLREKLKTQ